MLCAGVVHGDLSEFNILLGADGAGDHRPAAGGGCGGQQPRQRMLLRDVANLRDFFGRFAPELRTPTMGTRSGRCTRAGC